MKNAKEMIYQPNRLEPPEILAIGTHKGFTYYVLSLGTHPCAYVDVSETELCGVDYDDINISCHGDLTYSNAKLNGIDKVGWYIGWDYAHFGDYCMYGSFELTGKRWCTLEIIDECKKVVDEIVKNYK